MTKPADSDELKIILALRKLPMGATRGQVSMHTNLDASRIKPALESLVQSGQVTVHEPSKEKPWPGYQGPQLTNPVYRIVDQTRVRIGPSRS